MPESSVDPVRLLAWILIGFFAFYVFMQFLQGIGELILFIVDRQREHSLSRSRLHQRRFRTYQTHLQILELRLRRACQARRFEAADEFRKQIASEKERVKY